MLGVDVNGVRLALESLPNDPELLNELTTHKVRCDLLFAMNGLSGLRLVTSMKGHSNANANAVTNMPRARSM